MKIDEVFEKLIENPEDVYRVIRNGKVAKELSITEIGYFYYTRYDYNGVKLKDTTPQGGFNGNVCAIDDWELKRELVDFMTAANSGKRFKPETWFWCTDDNFRNLYDNLAMFSGREIVQAKILNGKWEIE